MDRPRKLFWRVAQHSAIPVVVGLALLVVAGTVAVPVSVSAAAAAGGQTPEGLTATEWTTMRAALDRDRHRLHAQGPTYYAPNHAQGLHVTFGPDGFEVRPATRRASGAGACA